MPIISIGYVHCFGVFLLAWVLSFNRTGGCSPLLVSSDTYSGPLTLFLVHSTCSLPHRHLHSQLDTSARHCFVVPEPPSIASHVSKKLASLSGGEALRKTCFVKRRVLPSGAWLAPPFQSHVCRLDSYDQPKVVTKCVTHTSQLFHPETPVPLSSASHGSINPRHRKVGGSGLAAPQRTQ